MSAGVDAHLYLERGRGAWALQGAKVELRPGQGAEVLLLGGGVRISADPTNADPLRVEPREDDGEPRPAVELAGGESYALGGAPLRGWALREVQGEVRVQRGTQRALHALAVAARDRVRLSGGDRVQTGSAASVALVRSGTGHLRLGAESALRVADALDLARGELSLASTRPLTWAFGAQRAALSGRGTLRRQGPTWELQATDGALTWSDSGAALALEPGRLARLGVDADGWELEAPGERVQGAGWSVELPEFVALGLTLTPQRAELRCVGRRTWRVARGAAAAVDAEGRARFPNGAVVSLPVGGVAEVHTALWGAASVAEVGSPLRPADVAAVASDRPALLSLPSGLRLAVEGPLQLEVGGVGAKRTHPPDRRLRADPAALRAPWPGRGRAQRPRRRSPGPAPGRAAPGASRRRGRAARDRPHALDRRRRSPR